MPTDCSDTQLVFEAFAGRKVVAEFDGGAITSNAGALLLREADRGMGLTAMVAGCFGDGRDAGSSVHSIETMVAQRIHGQALGYEDLNDHDALRHDPILRLISDTLTPKRANVATLAGKSTLNRLETAPEAGNPRYHKISVDEPALAQVFVDIYIAAHKTPPQRIILDLDATDDPLHGAQEGRFFPRLLSLLLLPAALYLRWPASAGGQAAARRHRCLGWCQGGDRARRCPPSQGLAGCADLVARGFGLCP
jgi:hypothetical protein